MVALEKHLFAVRVNPNRPKILTDERLVVSTESHFVVLHLLEFW